MGKKTTKRVVVPKPTIKETKMPIDPALFNPSPSYRYRSDLDKELAEDDLMDARDLKRLRVREITAKREARIREFEERSGIGNLKVSREREELAKALITNSQVQAQWLSMSPEARAILMTSANTLSQQGQSNSALAGLMPFMLLQMRQNPGTSVQEMVTLINTVRPIQTGGRSEMAELIKALTPLLQQQQPGKGGISEVITALAPFLSQMAQKDQALLLERLRNMEARIVNPIDVLRSLRDDAKLLEFGKSSPSIEIERLRANHEEKLMRINFEHQSWRDTQGLKRIEEEGRQRMMSDIFKRGLETAGPLLTKLVDSKTSGVNPRDPPGVKPGSVLNCVNCNTSIPLVGTPASVNCPNCGLVHNRNVEVDKPVGGEQDAGK